MKKTFMPYGWKTETIVRKYYHVKSVTKFMLIDNWIETNERMFPHKIKRHRCNLCSTPWRDKPLLESVYLVMFIDKYRNQTICNECRCNILESMNKL
jgi:hypothetical protein